MAWLTAATHELLPADVLWGANGATPEECKEPLGGLLDFEKLCDRLGLEVHRAFIQQCRWHFERYPHYLGRRRHFVSYQQYIADRRGPVRVTVPPRRW